MPTVTKSKEYCAGIDILKIISMCMIIICHIFSFGGIAGAAAPLSLNWFFINFLNPLCFCGVNCYALISGYLGVNGKTKYSQLATLWLSVVFYLLLFTSIFAVIGGEENPVSATDFIRCFVPVMTKRYWYFSAYFGLFILKPVLNAALSKLDRRELKKLIILIIAVFSVLQTVIYNDAFNSNSGYSMIWLCLMYLIGGYIKKYQHEIKVNKIICIVLIVVGIVISGGSEVLKIFVPSISLSSALVAYTSPTILIPSIALLLLFINYTKTKHVKVMSVCAKTTFGIYLIHTNPLVLHTWMTGAFIGAATMNLWQLLLILIGSTAGIFIVCAVIEFLRIKLFELLRIRKLLSKTGAVIIRLFPIFK